MEKNNALYNMIKHDNALTEKEREFLLKNENAKKFYKFVEVKASEIFDYTDLSIEALELLINNNLEGDALATMNDKMYGNTSYIRRQFEKFCIAIAMGEI